MPLLRFKQVLTVASRNFSRFRLQAGLIIVATISGTAGVIVSTGYAAGGREKILDQFAELGTNVIIVTPQQSRAVGGRARTGSPVTTLKDSGLQGNCAGDGQHRFFVADRLQRSPHSRR